MWWFLASSLLVRKRAEHRIIQEFEPKNSWAVLYKGGLISDGILTLIPLPKKGTKSLHWAENLNKLFNGGKFKLSVQGRDLAPLFGNGTKVKKTFEIKLPLAVDKKVTGL